MSAASLTRSTGTPFRRSRSHALRALLGLLIGMFAASHAHAAKQMYPAPMPDDVREQTIAWVAQTGAPPEDVQQQLGALWAFGEQPWSPQETFEAVIETFRLVDPKLRPIIDACREGSASLETLDLAGLPADEGEQAMFVRAQVTLYFARSLVQNRLYDEALAIFATLKPEEVVDPATCLFFRAVCEHQLLMKAEGLATIDALLERTDGAPARYVSVAKLMKYELEALKDKSLDEVARLMQDVERRLELGRAGKTEREKEDEIIARLDEIIQQLEQQQQQQQGGGGQGQPGKGNQSQSPADDSRVKGSTAPGDVDHKNLKKQGGWGAMPPKEAAKAKNLINRTFPAHYGDAIEEYFKKLAQRRAAEEETP